MAGRGSGKHRRIVQAKEHYEKALQLRTGMITARNARKVLKEAKAAVKLNPRLGEAHLLAGEALNVMAKYHQGFPTLLRYAARGHLRKAIQLLPGSTTLKDEARLAIGANMVAAGKLKSAIKVLERAARSQNQEIRMWALTHLGEAHYRRRNLEAAIAAWNQAREKTPDALHQDEDLPALHLRMAYRKIMERAIRKRNYRRAVEYGERILQLGPVFYERVDLNNLHDAYAALGETEKASKVLTLSVESLESPTLYQGE